jgi:WD40 repeat protein
LSVKVWDITNTKKPVLSICVQESLKSKLVNLFESDNIFDKFSLSTSADNSTILTGNYNNNFHLLNFENGSNTQYELNFKKSTISRPVIPGKCPQIGKIEAKKKTSALAFHPSEHCVAVAMLNCFFVYKI